MFEMQHVARCAAPASLAGLGAAAGGHHWHHALDIGGGYIISNTQEGVHVETLASFSLGDEVMRVVYRPGVVRFTPDHIVRRALSLLGSNRYSLLHFNCEHFAVWCCTGVLLSEQVRPQGIAAGVASRRAQCVGAQLAGSRCMACCP